MIVSIEPGSGADKAGLQLGDILLAANNNRLTQVESLMSALRLPLKNESLAFTILRAGEVMSIEVGNHGARRDGGANMPFPVPGRMAEFLRRATVQIRTNAVNAQGTGSGLVLAPDKSLPTRTWRPGKKSCRSLGWESHKARVLRKDRAHRSGIALRR